MSTVSSPGRQPETPARRGVIFAGQVDRPWMVPAMDRDVRVGPRPAADEHSDGWQWQLPGDASCRCMPVDGWADLIEWRRPADGRAPTGNRFLLVPVP